MGIQQAIVNRMSSALSQADVKPNKRGHYLLLGYDAQDSSIPSKRDAARPAHLERAARGYDAGINLFGGAYCIENSEGGRKLVGSAQVLDCDDLDAGTSC